jgi:hypothetical protein
VPICPHHHDRIHADGWTLQLGPDRSLTVRKTRCDPHEHRSTRPAVDPSGLSSETHTPPGRHQPRRPTPPPTRTRQDLGPHERHRNPTQPQRAGPDPFLAP